VITSAQWSYSSGYRLIFTARCTIVQSAVLRSHVVCLSVTLVDHDHIGWKSWKLIARTISPTSSLFVAQRSSRGTWRNLGTKCLVNTYVHNVRLKWVNRESRDRRWRCGCLLLSAHRAVIFAIVQLSCSLSREISRCAIDCFSWFFISCQLAPNCVTAAAYSCTPWFSFANVVNVYKNLHV